MKLIELTNDEYHSEREHVSKSWLDKIRKSPATLKATLDNKVAVEPTPAMAFGSMFHSLVLEPDTFNDEYILERKIDRRTKEGKSEYADFLKESEGKQSVSVVNLEIAQGMRASVMEHPLASKLFAGGDPEQSVFFTDSHGCKCKARADYLKRSCVVDLKSSVDASPRGFAKSVANFRYDVQDAHYSEGFKMDRFVFVAVEKVYPYLVGVYFLDEEAKIRGENLRSQDILTYMECKENDFWPGYGSGIQELSLPRWSF